MRSARAAGALPLAWTTTGSPPEAATPSRKEYESRKNMWITFILKGMMALDDGTT